MASFWPHKIDPIILPEPVLMPHNPKLKIAAVFSDQYELEPQEGG
jgi:hypothetical protein